MKTHVGMGGSLVSMEGRLLGQLGGDLCQKAGLFLQGLPVYLLRKPGWEESWSFFGDWRHRGLFHINNKYVL